MYVKRSTNAKTFGRLFYYKQLKCAFLLDNRRKKSKEVDDKKNAGNIVLSAVLCEISRWPT